MHNVFLHQQNTRVRAQHVIARTRRSIERWLDELEVAGVLAWVQREDASPRYHLRTIARSATDAALLTTLRTLITAGKATRADVQTLRDTASYDETSFTSTICLVL